MKRTVIVLIMMMLTTMTAWATVGERFTNDDGTLQYTVTSENPYEVSVAATESCTSLQVEIPASVTNNTITYAVTSIKDDAFAELTNLMSINIGDNVTSIGQYAFVGCSNLATVTNGDNVTSIGQLAFWKCPNLSSINIGANVTTIGLGAFNSCSSLSTFTVPASVTSIGKNAFYGCTGLESFAVSDGNEYYKSIDGVLFDSGVTSLLYYPAGNSATSYDIPNTVTSIAGYAFFGSSHLTAITIPSSVRNVGSSYDGAFEGCSSLADVYCYAKPFKTWEESNMDFKDGKETRFHVFDDWAWSTARSDANVKYVGDLSSRAIWTGTGGYCGNVATNVYYEITGEGTDKTLTIRKNPYIASNSDFSMADYSIYATRWSGEQYNIKTVVIEDGVTTIGDLAFFDFTNLTSVTIPDGVESIRLNAFNGCSSLTSVTIPASVTFIDDDAFRGCSSVASYTLLDGNTAYTSDGRALFNLDGTMLIVYPAANSATSYTIPSSVTTVNDYAFYGSSHLTSVTIPNSVTTIGQFAFEQCSGLTSVTIPNNVTVIKVNTFYGCSGLTSVTIPNSVTIIDVAAFAYCFSLTSVTIPNSVTTIGHGAFTYCSSLTSVTIPASVKSLDLAVFEQCPKLANVYCYADPFETWKDIYRAFSYHTTIHVFDAEAWSTKWSDEKITYKGDLAATPVNYIDASGREQTCRIYTELRTDIFEGEGAMDSDNMPSGWYVLKNWKDGTDFEYEGYLDFQGDTHIILCDGATMSVTTDGSPIRCGGTLTIYGQGDGTGTLTASNYSVDTGNTIVGKDALIINGGTVNASVAEKTEASHAIYAPFGDLTINGGTVNATATGTAYAIYGKNVSILGGSVTATGTVGTKSGEGCGNITLGWRTADDRIYASSYGGTVNIADGKVFTDGNGHNFYGTITDVSTLADKTLQPVTNAVTYIDMDGKTKTVTEYTEVTTDMNLSWSSGTYVVKSGVTLNGCISFDYPAVIDLIVCDGATLIVNGNDDGAFDGNTLNIYAQSNGTGMGVVNVKKETKCNHLNIAGGKVTLDDDDVGYSLYVFNDDANGLTVNGGDVTIQNSDDLFGAIYFDRRGFVTLNGGKLTVTNSMEDGYAAIEGKVSNTLNFNGGTAVINGNISEFKNINLNGGNVTVNGEIFNDRGYTVTYDFTRATDSYYINAFSNDIDEDETRTVAVADGKTLYNGTEGLSGTITDMSKLNDKTLRTYDYRTVSYVKADGTTGSADAIPLTGGGATTLQPGWYVVNSDVSYTGTVTLGNGEVNIILADGGKMNIGTDKDHRLDGSGIVNNGWDTSLTIYGQTNGTGELKIYSTDCGIYTSIGYTQHGGMVTIDALDDGISGEGSFTITDGTLNVKGYNGISSAGDMSILGGKCTVSAEGYYGFYPVYGTITLGWRTADDRIYASSYEGTVKIASGQALVDTSDGNKYYIGDGNAISEEDLENINGKTLKPALLLTDNVDNSAQVAALNGLETTVILQGRTLYKDGAWNTICLPFGIDVFSGTIFDNKYAEVRRLDTDPNSRYKADGLKDNDNGIYQTGQLDADGNMHIYFDQIGFIIANLPFIVKWDKADGYDTADPDTRDIKNPVFTNVIVKYSDINFEYANWEDESRDGNLSFFCTGYAPVGLPVNDKSKLFIGVDEDGNSQLYWPSESNNNDDKYYVGPCRAYLRLNNGLTVGSTANAVRGFSLNIEGEEKPLSISPVGERTEAFPREGLAGAWYTLDGRKLSGKPTAPGIYVKDGKKFVEN